jgi:hypothetical protein
MQSRIDLKSIVTAPPLASGETGTLSTTEASSV